MMPASAFLHNNRFGDAIMHAAMIRMNEILKESKSPLQHGCPIAERSLGSLPERNPVTFKRQDANASDALAWRLPPAEIKAQAKIQFNKNQAVKVVKIQMGLNMGLRVEPGAQPPDQEHGRREKKQHDQQIQQECDCP